MVVKDMESYQCVHVWSSPKASGLEEQMKKNSMDEEVRPQILQYK